jgi:hypothetical protein
MKLKLVGLAIGCASLVSAAGFAQGRGGGGRSATPGGQQSVPQSPDEAARAKTVDEIRAGMPQHAPLTPIKMPSKNTVFLAGLISAERPREDLDHYLDALWNKSRDTNERSAAFRALWDEAAKPKWARAAIEAFFRQRTGGQSLRPTDEPSRTEPKPR